MYKVRKRKEFEDVIRRQRQNIGCWVGASLEALDLRFQVKYGQWEASQQAKEQAKGAKSCQEFRRARSIFERALHVECPGLYCNILRCNIEYNY